MQGPRVEGVRNSEKNGSNKGRHVQLHRLHLHKLAWTMEAETCLPCTSSVQMVHQSHGALPWDFVDSESGAFL
jgi:hypothetical protein